MKKRDYTPLCIAALWIFAFALSCRLSTSPSAAGVSYDSFTSRILGASRAAFSQHFFLQADRFFHKGAAPETPQAFTNFLGRWALEITPAQHSHLSGGSIQEIMPWLRIATQMDPHNIDAYQVAAYWIEQAKELKLAEEIIDEGLERNPNSHELYEAKGRLFFHNQAFGRAAQALDIGIKICRNEAASNAIDAARMMTYRGTIYELHEQRDKALALYREILALVPHNLLIERRIATLEQGKEALSWSSGVIQTMFPKQGASHMMNFSAAEKVHDGHHHHEHCNH